MSGLSDLHDYDLTDAERLALCAELDRLNRVSPLTRRRVVWRPPALALRTPGMGTIPR